jgi:hypothetical protein
MSNLIWVGSRLSDIEGSERIFSGAITLLNSTRVNVPTLSFQDQYGYRPNQNVLNEIKTIHKFFGEAISKLSSEEPSAIFMSYGRDYSIPDSPFPYINSLRLDNLCQDKFRSRSLVSNFASVAPMALLFRADCTTDKISNLFPNRSKFVVQSIVGSGGEGTIIVDSDDINSRMPLIPGDELIVSPFIEGIPINVHAVIGERDTALFQPSIQIIELDNRGKPLYRGGDFGASLDIEPSLAETISETSKRIAHRLRVAGYRGIFGIDFIISDMALIFIEINPRFQASSFILNTHLRDHGLPTLHELQRRAFLGEEFHLGTVPPTKDSFVMIFDGGALSFPMIDRSLDASIDHFGAESCPSSLGAQTGRVRLTGPLINIVGRKAVYTSLGRQLLQDTSIFIV